VLGASAQHLTEGSADDSACDGTYAVPISLKWACPNFGEIHVVQAHQTQIMKPSTSIYIGIPSSYNIPCLAAYMISTYRNTFSNSFGAGWY